jgi:IS5 family transposase
VAADPLQRLAAVVNFECFERNWRRRSCARTGRVADRPAYEAVLMFKLLVRQTLYTLCNDPTEYQHKDPFTLHDPVPDAKTI